MRPGGGKGIYGKLSLSNHNMSHFYRIHRAERRQSRRYFAEGNIFVDGEAVCDDKWGREEAAVVCR